MPLDLKLFLGFLISRTFVRARKRRSQGPGPWPSRATARSRRLGSGVWNDAVFAIGAEQPISRRATVARAKARQPSPERLSRLNAILLRGTLPEFKAPVKADGGLVVYWPGGQTAPSGTPGRGFGALDFDPENGVRIGTPRIPDSATPNSLALGPSSGLQLTGAFASGP